MKKVVIVFAFIVLLIAGFVMWKTLSQLAPEKIDFLAIGNFLVLTLTLVVLIWYAYDTNSIARITQERWLREGVVGTTYSLEFIGQKGDAGRTLVRLHNPSTLVVRAKVNFNFCVYGQPVTAGALYDGNQVWLIFPQEMSQGWFEIETLLQKKGKNISAIIAEHTSANREEQLTATLELEFWDELGGSRKLPARKYYFDFERWAWIPRLAEHQHT